MRENVLLTACLTVLLVLIDQWSKKWAVGLIDEPDQIITPFFKLTYNFNHGIAFGIPFPRILLIIISIILLVGGGYLAIKYLDWKRRINILMISLMFGGAIGNFIDRILLKGTVDFISIYRYPIFNLADAFLTGGVIIFLIYTYYRKI